jgi:hypothetical protein
MLNSNGQDNAFPDRGFGRIVNLSLAILVCAVYLFFAPGLGAQQARASEYEVKAAYLFNFAKFVDWPTDISESKATPFTICVLGKNPFGAALNTTIAGETVGGHNVAVKEIASPQEAAGCRMLYISSSEERRLSAVVSGLGTLPILTVSEIPQFSEHGGMIEFVMEGNRVRFEANPAAAAAAGLSLSSSLLRVATKVHRDLRPGDEP